jgi:hypothetical protein
MLKFEDLQARAPEWRAELERKLAAHGGADVAAPYSQVAFAFPSPEPNPRSFDIPSIDSLQLKQWATAHGWRVQLTREAQTSDPQGHPLVRFTKEHMA